MARRKQFPVYPRKAHASGQARFVLNGRTVYLGVHGSAESHAEYNRLLAEWAVQHGTPTDAHKRPQTPTSVHTVAQLVARYLDHARSYYRKPDGSPAVEVSIITQTCRPLCVLYGKTLLADFGPKALTEVQQAMVSGKWADPAQPWARKTVNHRIRKVLWMFRWAVAHELTTQAHYDALCTVLPLRKGHTKAKEYPRVAPVPDAHVEAVMPFLGPIVGAMVRLQQLTGMRPGEVCVLRPCDLDRDSLAVDGIPVWVYRPPQHKGANHEDPAVALAAIVIGPPAQQLLLPFLDRPPESYCFSPREATAAFHRQRTAANRCGRSRARATQYRGNDRYQTAAYGLKIRRACDRAGVPRFHAHQLRHSVATKIDELFGREAAQNILRHRDPRQTADYARRSLQKAAEIIVRLG